MAEGSEVGGLLDELRAGGEVDSRGRFTLDRAQARAKMQKFQLVDARRYVLELVQAAALRGATAIVFDIDADDMRMRFDGQSFSGEELGELWGSIFADGDERLLRGLRQLALGLNAALGLGPRRITVRSGGQQVVLRPGSDEVTTAIDPVAGTTVHVELRARLGLVVEFFKNIGGRLGEEVHLRERCAHSPLAVTLDGKAIAGGLRVAGAIAEHAFVGDGVRGAIALVAGDLPATLRLVKDGVWIDTVPLEQCGPGIVAVVEGEHLRRDVSLAKIVADDALARVIGQVRSERWGLMARLVEAVRRGELPPEPTLLRVRAEVLQYLRARDLRKRPEVAVVADALRWPEARTGGGTAWWVTLAEMHAQVEAARSAGRTAVGVTGDVDEDEGKAGEVRPVLHYALKEYPELTPGKPAIARLDVEMARALGRILGCSPEVGDDALTRASARAQGERLWRRRGMMPRLTDDRRYLLRAPILAEGLRGELGIGALTGDEAPRVNGTIWFLRERCLLNRVECAWGIAALDVVIEGEFEPGEVYDDVVRDAVVVRAALLTIAALLVPLAALVEGSRGGPLEAAVRGLVKAWLLLVLDGDARDALWEALAVPPKLRPDVAAVQAVLPSPAQLRAGGGALDVLLRTPMFADFGGALRSLEELARQQTGVNRLAELDRSAAPDPSLGREIARLDRAERKILAGVLGGEATWSLWVPSMAGRRRARKFWSQPAETMDAVVVRMQAELRAAGLEPSLWSCRVQEAGIDGLLVMAHASVPPGVEPRAAQIDLRFEGRTLLTRSVELGIWPIVGVVEAKGLAPTPEWNEVEDEAVVTAVIARLRERAWELVAGLLAAQREDLTRWRWVAAPLLMRLAEEDGDRFAARVPGLTALPLLHTLAGGTMSIDEVEALLRERRTIECVPPTTTTVDLGAPPLLRESEPVLAGLRRRFGEASVVDGAERLRRRGREEKLAGLPTVERAALEPGQVWAAMALPTDGQKGITGEIGVARGRTGGGLCLTLCVRGKRVGVFWHEDFLAPVAAIIADDDLPLDAHGVVDQRSKRYGQHLKRCRRAVAELMVRLCGDYASLEGEARTSARVVLLAYAGERMEQVAKGAITTDRGLDAVRGVLLLGDVLGGTHSIAEIEALGRVDAVGVAAAGPGAGLELERPILRVDAAAERCVAQMKVRRIDERWDAELATLRALAREPRFELPDLGAVAWVERHATIAGGLQAQLWVARAPEEAPALVFTRAGREVGRLALIAALPCSGVVQGDGLVIGAAVELEGRQRASLGKQICMLYEQLAKQLRAGKFAADERERVQARLVEVDAALESSGEALLGSIGKPLEQLKAALAGIVSPALRKARAEARREAVVKARAEAKVAEARAEAKVVATKVAEARVAAAKVAETKVAAAKVVEARAVEARAAEKVEPAPVYERTPEQRLLAVLRAELAWARERHGSLLDTLGLDRLALGEFAGGGIAAFDAGIVVQRKHPLVLRMLRRLAGGAEVDAIDLSFLVSTVYTLMNEVAEEIDADDERAFVARMAESLALGLR